MIDFHTHILPGIDDGSRDPEETGLLLREEAEQGVDMVISTPHFYADHTSPDHFLEKRERAYRKTEEKRQEIISRGLTVPAVKKAAEVYYFPGMGRADRLRDLTVEGTDILMVEMPFCQWDRDIFENIREITERQRLKVVLVHLERYYRLQKKKQTWEEILGLPVVVQLNTGSFLSWGEKRICKKILGYGLPVILGSDCHNMRSRKPNLRQGRAALAGMMGPDAPDKAERTAAGLLEERKIT